MTSSELPIFNVKAPSRAMARGEIARSSSSEVDRLPSQTEQNSTSRPEPSHSNIDEQLFPIIYYIGYNVWMALTLGLARFYYTTWRLVQSQSTTENTSPDSPASSLGINVANVFLVHAKWHRLVRKLMKVWKLVRLGCALLLPLSIAFLQLDSVFNNVLGRTTAISAFIFSSTGLALSCLFIASKTTFNDRNFRNKWVEVSRSGLETMEAVEFWALLALPLSSLVWSVLFCVSTILIVVWTEQNGRGILTNGDYNVGQAAFVSSATFLTTLTLTIIAQIYRAMKMFRRP
ncbi:hypothetical protein BDZ97DRAFT_1917736 [Flammula alnicola]|nr:hypothetical protein BDZ97DRAFT_1917736 [Flammula alnicola]